ncbi:MAG: FG-GAP-like repeat-containing protein [Deltaproteobacteria bacterium]|nr:FG-GAP-like repeat-containing protein [Deltaproteobacteria bacterium]
MTRTSLLGPAFCTALLGSSLLGCGPTTPSLDDVQSQDASRDQQVQRTDAVVADDTPEPLDARADAASPEDAAQPLDAVTLDAPEDSSPDSSADASLDASMDGSPDVTTDAAPDVAQDAPRDVAMDAPRDAVPDAAPDAGCALRLCGSACVDTNTSTAHCGACNTACPGTTNGSPTCTTGTCSITCNPGFFLAAGRCVALPVPRPLAPLSARWVTSATPTLRWSIEAPTDGAVVEICRTRACSTVLASFTALGTSGRPTAPLTSGVYWWRLRATRSGGASTVASVAWSFVVAPRVSATSDRITYQQMDSNGDGAPEAIVYTFEDTGGATSTPEARIYNVAAGSLVAASSPIVASRSLRGAISIGDVNGDGFTDMLADQGGTGGCVFHGGATALASVGCSLSSGSGAPISYAYASPAEDINGDGYADLLVSGERGTAFVRYGSSAGLGAAMDEFGLPRDAGIRFLRMTVGDFNADGTREIAAFNITGSGAFAPTIYQVVGGRPSDTGRRNLTASLGISVAIDINPIAADLNGDGFDDLAVGVQSNDFPRRGGRLVVYFGSATGLPTTPSQIIMHPDGDDDLFGQGFNLAGDLNADGYADVVVGGPLFTSETGRAYVYLGSATGLPSRPSQTFTGSGRQLYGQSTASVGMIDATTQGLLFGAPYALARRGLIDLRITGGAPLLTAPLDTAMSPSVTPGFGYRISGLTF